jgi:Holliday junction resolvase
MAGEKNFENKIKKFLKDRGCWYVKYFANRNTRAGVPDILACVNGYFVAIEVKAENGKPSELQKWNVEQIQKSRGYAVIIYPNQYDDFVLLVDAIMHVNSRTAVALEDKINSRGGA